MNTLNNTLFLTLLLFLAMGALEAQRSENLEARLDHDATAVEQYIPAKGDHVEGEAILSFETPQTNAQKQALERRLLKEENVTIKEWSPSSKYVLLNVDKSYTSPCGIDVNGNPYGILVGEGSGFGLNYEIGTNRFVEDKSDVTCLPVDFDPVTGLLSVDFSSYSPVMDCETQELSNLTPAWSSNPFATRPRVAIIDSGIKGMGRNGYINGSRVNQKVIPDGCNTYNCNAYFPSLNESWNFNSHGKFITTLITGWFKINGLEKQLTINSYKVLNSQLKCSVFQVVKAIELATADRNHIISLSLGFIPFECQLDNGPYEQEGGVLEYGKSKTQQSILHNAIKAAEDAGLIIITSAGNGGYDGIGDDLGEFPQYPAAEPGIENLVTVGALACDTEGLAEFSNYSSEYVDLFTIGNRVSVYEGFNCLRTVDGTSFACPIVTAKAAFHVCMQWSFNAADVLCSLRGESRPFPMYAKYGIVDTSVPPQLCNKNALSGPDETVINQADVISKPAELVISPNPFSDLVTISTPTADAFITIIDARGTRVLSREVKQVSTTLELSNLKPGAYWVNVRSATGTETRTIVKQ